MVGYRAGWLYYRPRTIENSRGIPLDAPVADDVAFQAADELMEAVWYPNHRDRLKTVTDDLMENLSDAQGNGVLAIFHRYIWCYATLQARGPDPGDVDLDTLADMAYPRFIEVVNAPKELLVALYRFPFHGESDRMRNLSIGQWIMLTGVGTSALEAAFGEVDAERVRREVIGRDWCPTTNGIQTVVDPTRRTAWLEQFDSTGPGNR